MQTFNLKAMALFTDLNPGHSPWRQRLDTLMSFGVRSGADLVEIFLERTDHLGVLAEQDKITSVSPAFGMGAGIRVFRGGQDGFVSTNDLSDQGLHLALEQALAMLQLNTIPAMPGTVLKALASCVIMVRAKKTGWVKLLSWTRLRNDCSKEHSACRSYGQHLEVRRGSFSRDWQEVLVAASDGTFARDIRLHQSSGLSVLAADGDHRSSISRRYGSSDRPHDLRHWDINASAEDVCESAATMLRADYVDGGQMPVVLANRFGGVIFHEACGHLLETTQVERGSTPFAESIGESIAHPAVTAIDEGLSEGAFGSLSMDDEGMEPQRTVLIENGVLKRFISDRAGEMRTGHARTGSGRRQSHGFRCSQQNAQHLYRCRAPQC